MSKPLVMAGIALAFVALGLLSCNRQSDRLEPGAQAPDFRADDLTGLTQYLSAQKKPVVLSFFATWCEPCREEIGSLKRIQKDYGERVQVFCIVTDPENKDKANSLAKALQPGYPFLMDEGQTIMKAYGVTTLPTTVVLDAAPRIQSRFQGFGEAEEQSLRDVLTRLTGLTPLAPVLHKKALSPSGKATK